MAGMLNALKALESIKKQNEDADNPLALMHIGLMKISSSYIPRDIFLSMDMTYVLELFETEEKLQKEMNKKMNKNKPKKFGRSGGKR